MLKYPKKAIALMFSNLVVQVQNGESDQIMMKKTGWMK